MAGQNGGGTFVLAYAICIISLGIPLYVLEASAGKLANRGPVGLFREVNPIWGPWFGWFLVIMTVTIMSYYLVIIRGIYRITDII
jgi:NSS family neurotransmitter:Na+ symporter